MECSLYFLVDKDNTKVKVGISKHFEHRLLSIRSDWGEIDNKKSILVVGKTRDISNFEKCIHFIFQKYSINENKNKPGHTEWFRIDCYESMKSYLENIINVQDNDYIVNYGIDVNVSGKMTYKSSLLAELLFPEYRYRILTLFLLNPEKSLYTREILREIESTGTGGVHRELKKMVDAGLLISERHGNTIRYRADKDCEIYDELYGILDKI